MKATTMLEGGDTSDVFMIKEIDNLINWQAQGFAAPLDTNGYDMSGFVGTEVNYAVDGVQYAIPFRSDFWVLFYNKDLFCKYPPEPPHRQQDWPRPSGGVSPMPHERTPLTRKNNRLCTAVPPGCCRYPPHPPHRQ